MVLQYWCIISDFPYLKPILQKFNISLQVFPGKFQILSFNWKYFRPILDQYCTNIGHRYNQCRFATIDNLKFLYCDFNYNQEK